MFVELKKSFLGRAAGERIDVSETDAQHLIQQQTAVAVDDDLIGPAVTRALDAALARQTQSIDAAVNQSLKAFADAKSLSRKHAAPVLFGAGGDGDPHGKTFGDWALAVARGDRNYLEKHYGSRFVEYAGKAALAEASGVTGGYTVPPDFYQQLMSIMAEETFVRPRAFVVPMASATMQIPYLDNSTVQSAGVSPFFGGVQMYWTAESQTRTETEPQFKQLDLKAWELSGYSVSSNVLLQDSVIGREKFLMTLFAKSLAWFEEYAFLQGNGAGKPQGMLGAAATVSLTRQTGNQVQYADVAGMWAKLLPISWGKAFWTCSPSVVPQLLQLKDGILKDCLMLDGLKACPLPSDDDGGGKKSSPVDCGQPDYAMATRSFYQGSGRIAGMHLLETVSANVDPLPPQKTPERGKPMHNWQGRLVAIAQENAAVLCEIKDTAQALAAALGKVKDEDRPLLKSEFYKMVNSALTEIDRDADAITWKIVERMESERWIG